MFRVFVVTGLSDNNEFKKEDILYAGVNKEKAESFDIGEVYNTLELETWINGEIIKVHKKRSLGLDDGWVLEYDKTVEMKEIIRRKEIEKEDIESDVELYKEIINRIEE